MNEDIILNFYVILERTGRLMSSRTERRRIMSHPERMEAYDVILNTNVILSDASVASGVEGSPAQKILRSPCGELQNDIGVRLADLLKISLNRVILNRRR